LSLHRLAIEIGRRSHIPRDKRSLPCVMVQTGQHVICFCTSNDDVRFKFDTVSFTNIDDFLLMLAVCVV